MRSSRLSGLASIVNSRPSRVKSVDTEIAYKRLESRFVPINDGVPPPM